MTKPTRMKSMTNADRIAQVIKMAEGRWVSVAALKQRTNLPTNSIQVVIGRLVSIGQVERQAGDRYTGGSSPMLVRWTAVDLTEEPRNA